MHTINCNFDMLMYYTHISAQQCNNVQNCDVIFDLKNPKTTRIPFSLKFVPQWLSQLCFSFYALSCHQWCYPSRCASRMRRADWWSSSSTRGHHSINILLCFSPRNLTHCRVRYSGNQSSWLWCLGWDLHCSRAMLTRASQMSETYQPFECDRLQLVDACYKHIKQPIVVVKNLYHMHLI